MLETRRREAAARAMTGDEFGGGLTLAADLLSRCLQSVTAVTAGSPWLSQVCNARLVSRKWNAVVMDLVAEQVTEKAKSQQVEGLIAEIRLHRLINTSRGCMAQVIK